MPLAFLSAVLSSKKPAGTAAGGPIDPSNAPADVGGGAAALGAAGRGGGCAAAAAGGWAGAACLGLPLSKKSEGSPPCGAAGAADGVPAAAAAAAAGRCAARVAVAACYCYGKSVGELREECRVWGTDWRWSGATGAAHAGAAQRPATTIHAGSPPAQQASVSWLAWPGIRLGDVQGVKKKLRHS